MSTQLHNSLEQLIPKVAIPGSPDNRRIADRLWDYSQYHVHSVRLAKAMFEHKGDVVRAAGIDEALLRELHF